MALKGQTEPAGGRDIVNGALSERAQRGPQLPALCGVPQTGAALPVYLLSREEAALADPLQAAKLVGWKYPVIGGASPGIASLLAAPDGLKFAGINHGPLPERLLEAAVLAESNLGPLNEVFEPRLLEIPALRIYALWLYRDQENYFISLLDGQPPGSSQLQMENGIAPRIGAALTGAAVAMRARRPQAGGSGAPVAPGKTSPRGHRASNWGYLIGLLVVASILVAFATLWGRGTEFVACGPLYAWLIELLVFIFLFVVLGFGYKGYWFGMLVDGRNKISLSRLQMVAWTILFVATFFVIYIWNIGHPPKAGLTAALNLTVPDAVWVLMGLAGLSAAGTPLILSAKSPPDSGGTQPPAPADPSKFIDGVVAKRRSQARPEWSDIVLGDDAANCEAIDVSKVQQLFLSLVAVVVYGYAIAQTMMLAAPRTGAVAIDALPGMTSGFLTLIAASHASYLAYKAVSHSN